MLAGQRRWRGTIRLLSLINLLIVPDEGLTERYVLAVLRAVLDFCWSLGIP
jgi:hypothetical protein